MLWLWRNDPAARALFRNTDEIGWEAHLRWFAAARDAEDQCLLMGEIETRPVGMVRLDRSADRRAEVHVNISPELRGRGYGKELLARACMYARDEFGCRLLEAGIKPENLRSIALFSGAGFSYGGLRERLARYTLNLRSESEKK